VTTVTLGMHRPGVELAISLSQVAVVVVVVGIKRPSGTVYMAGGNRCPEEMRNSTRL